MRARRCIPHLVGLVGAVVLLIGFGRYSGASMPYLDPTPELRGVQRTQMESAKTLAWMGGLVFFGGVAWAVIRRRSRSGHPRTP